MNSDFQVARCLLNSGANLQHQDLSKRTPLHAFFNPTVKHVLDSYQSEIDTAITDEHGITIAHYVSLSKTSSPTDLLRCLPEDPNLTPIDHQGRTVMHFALQRGNIQLIEYFFQQPSQPPT